MAALMPAAGVPLRQAARRMKTLGRKCLLCSGADKLRKIITLFVLVAISSRPPPQPLGGRTLRHATLRPALLCAAIKMPIIQLIFARASGAVVNFCHL